MALKDKYFTISEAAKQLGVTRQTISRWVAKGYVPADKIGRETLIKQKDLNKYQNFRLSTDAAKSILALYEAKLEEYLHEKGRLEKGTHIEVVGFDERPDAEKLSVEDHAEMRSRFIPILEGFLKDFSRNVKTEKLPKKNQKTTSRRGRKTSK